MAGRHSERTGMPAGSDCPAQTECCHSADCRTETCCSHKNTLHQNTRTASAHDRHSERTIPEAGSDYPALTECCQSAGCWTSLCRSHTHIASEHTFCIRHTQNAQFLQQCQTAQRRRNAAVQLVVQQIPIAVVQTLRQHTRSTSTHARRSERTGLSVGSDCPVSAECCHSVGWCPNPFCSRKHHVRNTQFASTHGWQTLRTHRVVSWIRLPSVDGMLPLSWLLNRYLLQSHILH
jgi:hypothetical protein